MAVPVKKDQEIDLRIDSLAYGGRGVARLNGFVVFVNRALPGDVVRARVTKVKKSHAEAVSMAVVEAGAPRVEAPCQHYPECGGCRFQDLDYAAQLDAKAHQVADSLARIGKIEIELEPAVPAASVFHYRNKLEYSFTTLEDGTLGLGFHRAGRWDEVLDVERCWLTTDLGNGIREATKAWARAEGLPVFDQERQEGYLRHLVVREARNTGQALVMLVTAPGDLPGRRRPDRGPACLSRGALDPLGGQRHPGRGDEPAVRPPLGRGGDRGADPRPALPRPPERLPADEHRDVRGALHPGGASTRR